MKSKLSLIPLAFVFLIFVSLVLVPTVASAGQETRLGTGYEPDIYGDRVVWSNGSIHLFDISNGTDTELNSSLARHPAIYGDKIVWLDNSSGNPNLCVYNISTGGKFHITENVTGGNTYVTGGNTYVTGGSEPAIYGNIIVWQDYIDNEKTENRTSNVYMYDLSTFTRTQISNTGYYYGSPDIYEDRIVWINNSRGYGNGDSIWMYNISTNNRTEISAGYGEFDCAIYGDVLASYGYCLNWDCISVHNLSTGEVSGLNIRSSNQFDPDIYMDRVVWLDERNCRNDIYMYNLSTANETLISTSGLAGRNPVIYGDRIVWLDGRTNLWRDTHTTQSAIHMYELSAEPVKPHASFTANVTSGKSPLTVLFTDTSTGGIPTNWYWDFGDGIHSKHAQTATHTFRKAGEYTVSLTATNAAGSDTRTVEGCIRVSE